MTDSGPGEPTHLDPEDWDAFRALAHRAVDDTIDSLRRLEREPAWRPLPPGVADRLAGSLGPEGIGEQATYAEYRELIEPYTNGCRHPRFFGWVQGTGVPLASVADFLAASINQHMAGFSQSGPLVEQEVLACLAQLMGLPAAASGILLSGATMANATALAVARRAHAPGDYDAIGLQGPGRPRLAFYGSVETHGWAGKVAEFLGFGRDSFRRVPVGAEHRIDVAALAARVADDRRQGLQPFAVIGNAGTINCGAIDPLADLAGFCRAEGLWFHVDGAFGALASLSPRHRHLLRGLELADSVAFDLHKWMYLPFEIGCLLVRDGAAHRAAFQESGGYLRSFERGVIAAGLPFAGRGVELTRGFKALKAWMCLRAYGTRRFGAAIERNIDDVQRVVDRLRREPELEVLGPAPLNVVCFRYRAGLEAEAELARINEEILLRIQESGLAVISSTSVEGRFALRIANTNHRARAADLTQVVDAVLALGRELAPRPGPR
ncbi:MAG: amino acid decarboxylase [Proteobacteria bacterium]|nr:amino acid decarboxylase [Pseudomonadota bacterium]